MKVAVFGAGTMGSGIAQTFARSGNEVLLCDIKKEFVDNAIAKIAKGFDKQIEKGKMTAEDKEATMANIKYAEKADCADVDLVVEAVLEVMQVKKDLFGELDGICKESTIFASNTSSLSITEMGKGIAHPVIGMHFFNPVPAMKLVEVIKGANTTAETFNTVYAAAQQIGKDPVEVNEAPGFVVNRILVPMCNEACMVYEEGIASAEDIDKAMKLGANHPMGPLALTDLIGLDIVLAIMNVLYTETADSKYRPALILKKMVRAGKLGRKTGEGFFKYN